MKQEILIQILALVTIGILSIFFNPLSANLEGKIIFSGIIVILIVLFVVFDIYKSIEENKNKYF